MTGQMKYLTYERFKSTLKEIQESLAIGLYQEGNNHEYFHFTPQEVYSQHLADNVGPLIRIGTPVR